MTEADALGLLGIARRAGRAVIGARAVTGAAGRGAVAVLVVAEDAGANALARLGPAAAALPVARLGTRAALGRALGRGEVAVVGITDRRLAERIVDAKEALTKEREEDAGAEERPRRQVR